MATVGLLPALALVSGAVCGLRWDAQWLTAWLVPLAIAGWIAWCVDRVRRFIVLTLICGFFCAAATLAADARDRAVRTPLRAVLDREIGGFAMDTPGAGARHDPIAIRAVLVEDGAQQGDFTTLRAVVVAVRFGGEWRSTDGGLTLTVGGHPSQEQIVEWRAGRTIEAFATFRRPSRYLNDGVPDFERQLALDGTTLFGSVKSGQLVEVRSVGGFGQEIAGRLRLHVRRSVERWIAPHDQLSAAIVAAVLIGDRTGLPDDIRVRLQAAGTYHVIAISGGNIAILAALVLGALCVCGITGRAAALVTVVVLVAYAHVVTAGASVWRATLMALIYFCARLLDHRSPPWHAIALAAAIVICARPLDVRDVGFILTFGATAALLEAARRTSATSRHHIAKWLIASLAASMAAEVALLPVSAWTFSRVTSAGLVLNLVAVPLMGLVQVSGIAVSLLNGVETIARPAGWAGHVAAAALVDSARLVDVAPWLATRVPPPHGLLVIAYYIGLAAALSTRGLARVGCLVLVGTSAAAIFSGQPAGWLISARQSPALRVTAFDVGQGDATLLEFSGRSTLLVDAGGTPFGNGSFDIGSRVLSPALWARGVRGLDALLLTHGDPDHIGGAASIVNDFTPAKVWEGIPVAQHRGLQAVLEQARQAHAELARTLAGDELSIGGARVRVLHPPAPDWERQRVRNDDSVVLEVRYGDAAVLLLGDVGAAIERAILPQLTPARIRILKVAHHGSRTSTSAELVERWRPQIAVISCGRGNTFGHPAPEVLRRLESIGAAVYRTDVDGQVTIDTDGVGVRVRTYVGGQR
ncbi:MAG TPA: DNA internalization-related competence protein ComEC/Rec2 [Vicinamibacterales bacterium]